MFIYIVVFCESVDDGDYRSYNLCAFDSKEKAVEFIDSRYGNIYIRDGESDYWLLNSDGENDCIYIETWGVR